MQDEEKNGNSVGEATAIDTSFFLTIEMKLHKGFAYLLDLNQKLGSFERNEMSSDGEATGKCRVLERIFVFPISISNTRTSQRVRRFTK